MADKKKVEELPDLLKAAEAMMKIRPVRVVRGNEDVGFHILVTGEQIQTLTDAINVERRKRGKEEWKLQEKNQKAKPTPKGEASEKK